MSFVTNSYRYRGVSNLVLVTLIIDSYFIIKAYIDEQSLNWTYKHINPIPTFMLLSNIKFFCPHRFF